MISFLIIDRFCLIGKVIHVCLHCRMIFLRFAHIVEKNEAEGGFPILSGNETPPSAVDDEVQLTDGSESRKESRA